MLNVAGFLAVASLFFLGFMLMKNPTFFTSPTSIELIR